MARPPLQLRYELDGAEPVQAASRRALLAALAAVDLVFLRFFEAPALAQSGVRVRCDKGPEQRWRDIGALLRTGEGGPAALACWRAAELRRQGLRAQPVSRAPLPRGPTLLTFELGGWDGSNLPLLQAYLGPCLEALVASNLAYMRVHRVPPLYRSGCVYQREVPGQEDWRNYGALLRHGGGDCEDLACIRTGELRLQGVPARPIVRGKWKEYPDEPEKNHWSYHVLVGVGDEREDPSKILGMQTKPTGTPWQPLSSL